MSGVDLLASSAIAPMNLSELAAFEVIVATLVVILFTSFWSGRFGASRAARQAVDDYKRALEAKTAQCVLCESEFKHRIEALDERLDIIVRDKAQLSELNVRLINENAELKERIAQLEIQVRVLQGRLNDSGK